MARLTNWAGNITFGPDRLYQPSALDELRALVAGSDRVRCLGTGHSFNRIADTDGVLVSVRDLPRTVRIDPERATATVAGGVRYGELTAIVEQNGFALANLGSLPHISVAGACATGTHGSGDSNRVLASAVSALTLVTADGELLSLTRADRDFAGAVISLGCLGPVTELTLDLLPSFQLRQYVYDDLAIGTLCEHFDEITAASYSFSLFTRWQSDRIDQVWLKSAETRPAGEPFFGAVPAGQPRHPVPGSDPSYATEQGGLPGPWQQRLPHFRLEFTPSSGAEIQSEYFVAREHAVAAIEAVNGLAAVLDPVLQIAEIRTVAADELWLSPFYRTDRVALHFTWIADHGRVEPVVAELERALRPFGAVPHWAKLFLLDAGSVAALHPRFADFTELARRIDPGAKFGNEFTRDLGLTS